MARWSTRRTRPTAGCSTICRRSACRLSSNAPVARPGGGLSGSLEAPDIPRLLPFAPDFLGFRGALCGQARRTGSIDADAVGQIRALIPEERPAGSAARVDYRLLAARGYSPDSADLALGTDKIFVRDFVLPVQIGAYSFEHGHTQKVRFDVTRRCAAGDQQSGGHAPRLFLRRDHGRHPRRSSRAAMCN